VDGFYVWLINGSFFFGAYGSIPNSAAFEMLPSLAHLGVEAIDLLVRKAAHITEYFIFALLLMNVLNNRSGFSRRRQLTGGGNNFRSDLCRWR